jgi:hypothetical protein
MTSLLNKLFKRYQEDKSMPDALQQFAKETIDELLNELSPKERLKGMSVDELWAALSPQDRAALTKRVKEEASSPPPNEGTTGK